MEEQDIKENSWLMEAKVAMLEAKIAELEVNVNGANNGQIIPAQGAFPIPQVPADADQRPFQIVAGKVKEGSIPAPVKLYFAAEYTIDPTEGNILLHADRTTGQNATYNLTIDQTSRQASSTHAEFILYEYQNGAVLVDYRPTALPLFDLQ